MSAALGLALLAGAVPGPANRANAAVAETCSMQLGSVTAGGDHRGQGISATSPPTMLGDVVGPHDVYPDGLARLSGQMAYEPAVPAGEQRGGWLILGSSMYLSGYTTDATGRGISPDSVNLKRVGGGWENFTAFETSRYYEGPGHRYLRMNQYALRNDGVFFRWTINWTGWSDTQTYPGFAAVKAMTLISQTRTYDTFLANTHRGALYTIHIPTTSPLAPVVTPVRTSTWQAFDTLVAERCGSTGSLVLGIDKETRSGWLYAVGHAAGTATVIQSLGELPIQLDDPAYFRWYRDTPEAGHLAGE